MHLDASLVLAALRRIHSMRSSIIVYVAPSQCYVAAVLPPHRPIFLSIDTSVRVCASAHFTRQNVSTPLDCEWSSMLISWCIWGSLERPADLGSVWYLSFLL